MSIGTWLKGLVAAVISAVANSIAGAIVAPETFNFAEGWKKLLTLALVSAIVGAAMYLKQSPLPTGEEDL